MAAWLSRRPDGVLIAVRVTPGAARNEVGVVAADARGDQHLPVKVTAPPADGRANVAVLKLLAKRWRLPGGSLSVVGGATARRKLLQIAGDPETLSAAIEGREHHRSGEGRG